MATPDATYLSDRRVEEALCALHRSVSNCQFYPPSHPLLVEALREGYQAWRRVEDDHRWEDGGLRLRSGLLCLGESPLGAENPAILNLARCFSVHGLANVARRGPLSFEGFSRFVSLLASGPESLRMQGGIVGAWKTEGFSKALSLQPLSVASDVQNIGRVAREEARAGEWGHGLSQGGDLASLSDPLLLSRFKSFQQRGPKERRVLELLLRMGRTHEIGAFLRILQEITTITGEYVDEERFREAFHVVLFLYREGQNMDALGEEGKRDYLLDSLRLLVRGAFLQWLIGIITSDRGHEEAEIGSYILRSLGKPAVVPLINALVGEKDRGGRRQLLDVLVSLGDTVVPFAIKMLDDQRWFVVRNMVTVLGGIGSPDALRALGRIVRDPDSRIRKEVARTLSRSPGSGAEDLLEGLLADSDPSVRLMAISASACHRSERLLDVLWAMFTDIPIYSSGWNLKTTTLQAMGRMGLPCAVKYLDCVLKRRPVFWRGRWETVQVTAVQALGELGDETAHSLIELLRAHRSPAVRQAAGRALAAGAEPSVPEPA